MKFNSYSEIKLHPEAKIIPEHIWTNSVSLWNKSDFKYCSEMEFPDDLISLLKIIKDTPNSLLTYVRENKLTLKAINKKVGFVIALSYNTLEQSCLSEINHLLEISDEDFLNISAEVGNVGLIQVLNNSHEPEWMQKIVKANSYKIFREAAANGFLRLVEYLTEEMPSLFHAMLAADDPESYYASNYYSFGKAAENGHLEILQYFEEKAPDQLKTMIAANNYSAFRLAAANGHMPILNYLIERATDELQEMILAQHCFAFREAASNGHVLILRFLAKQAPDELQKMIAVLNYAAFRLAAAHGHELVLKFIAEHAPYQLQTMIAAEDYEAFRRAASHGSLSILNYLIEKAPNKLQDMIASRDYSAFRAAAANGHLQVLRYLGELAHHQMQAMIVIHDYAAFRWAAAHGHIMILDYLAQQAPGKLQAMIASENYETFRWAASSGQQRILDYLVKQAPDKVHEMIEAQNYAAFRWAATYGHQMILDYLVKKIPYKLQAMIASDHYRSFAGAARNGHILVLEYLAEKWPAKLPEMIAAGNYEAFCGAASKGHLSVLHRLVELAPDKREAMMEAQDYCGFREAAFNGHLSVLRYLVEQMPNKLEEMIAANNYEAFRGATCLNYSEIARFLLPISFPYAEAHEHEYASYTTPFIAERLDFLRRTQVDNRESPILIRPEDVKQLFYLARALIRRRAPLEDLRLILEIPEVRDFAHQAITPEYPNELLRIAARLGNRDASDYLLTIPAVQREAQANNFYIEEYQGRIDLRRLAQDRESSMTALSQEEAERLERLKNHYLVTDQRSPNQILEELRAFLIKRYEKTPAAILGSDLNNENERKSLTLPMTWEAFKNLSLSEKEEQEALVAYYKNKSHSAWRFLAKPNPWIHPNAFFINHNNSGAWSCFEAYDELIAVLFLAAKDESIPGIEGYSVGDRVTQFIDELALIGRAHNWDNKNAMQQEYDDLTADKPSCYSGIKRRLFQSVQGHPLLNQLTLDLLQQEIREFVWAHFQKTITEENYQGLCTIWRKSIDMEALNSEEENVLSRTNILKEDQEIWFKTLRSKYGDQINCYEVFLSSKFDLQEHDSHFIRFGYLGLDRLLKNPTFQGAPSSDRPLSAETDAPLRFFYQRGGQKNTDNVSKDYSL